MLVYCLYLALTFIGVSGQKCDNNGILVYEDLGCTAEYGTNKTCPVKYNCLGLEPSEKNCYFRGKSYGDLEQVENNLSYPSCHVACHCSTDNKNPSFTCAVLDCPEWLGVPVHDRCYRKYSLDGCCSSGEICPPFDEIEKCVVEGKEYKEGERFYPSNTCFNCVCQKGFKGKFEEPFCKRMSCGQQLRSIFSDRIQASCAPLYEINSSNDVLCCPSYWFCPDGSEKIEGDTKSEEVCKFGTKTLKVGQHFKKSNGEDEFLGRRFNNVTCECVIPPLVKCVGHFVQ